MKWHNLNEQGYIINTSNIIIWPLPEKGGVYIYKIIINEKEKTYVGSTIDLKRRFRQHRHRAWVYQETSKYNTALYNYAAHYGWQNFKFAILELVDLNFDIKENRKFLFSIEQKYLNQFYPELNTSKIAGSTLGFKHKDKLILNENKNSKYTKLSKIKLKPDPSKETIVKMKLHSKNKIVSLYTKNNLLIKNFPTIRKAAEYVQLSPTSVSTYIKNEKLWNHSYRFVLKSNAPLNEKSFYFPLDNFNEKNIFIVNTKIKKSKGYIFEVWFKNKIIYRFESIAKASRFLNISYNTLTTYYSNNKLWNNKFKFNII